MGSIGVGHKRVEGCQVFGMRWEEKMRGVLNEEERSLRIKDHKMASKDKMDPNFPVNIMMLVGSDSEM